MAQPITRRENTSSTVARYSQPSHVRTNRSAGGGRGVGTSVGSPRWVRIFRMTTGSSIVATTRMRPPQRGQVNTVTANVWRTRSGHDDLRGEGGGEFSTATVVVDSRHAAGGGRHRLARASSDRHDRLALRRAARLLPPA